MKKPKQRVTLAGIARSSGMSGKYLVCMLTHPLFFKFIGEDILYCRICEQAWSVEPKSHRQRANKAKEVNDRVC